MRRTLAWVAGIALGALFAGGLTAIAVAPTKVAKPEFVPGSHFTVDAPRVHFEGTVVAAYNFPKADRTRKGDRLEVSAIAAINNALRPDGEPVAEYAFHREFVRQ